MSAIVGIDVSTKALDLVKLDENDQARWDHIDLPGRDAWTRTLGIGACAPPSWYWDDVYLVAIEAPYSRGQAGTLAVLNRVVGALAMSLPRELRRPERCWVVRPDEWKTGLGLRAKPTSANIEQLAPGLQINIPTELILPGYRDDVDWQNGRDAYCIARWARDTNAKAIAASLTPDTEEEHAA